MTDTIKFKDIGSSLGTRNLGVKIRQLILKKMELSEKVFLDFNEVDIVTNSFADECFSKLRKSVTAEEFRAKIAFINTNDFVQRVIISSL